MSLDHTSSLVVVWSSKNHGKEVSDNMMKIGNVAHIFEVEHIDTFFVKNTLIKVGYNLLNIAASSQFVIK